MTEDKSEAGWAWYLLPFFLGIVGGAITYYKLRDRDRKTADICLKLGAVMTGISVVLGVLTIVLEVLVRI